MNEQRIAQLAREALDESAEHLPWRVTHRLATAREAALARMPSRAKALAFAPPVLVGGRSPILVQGAGHGRPSGNGSPGERPSLGRRIAAVLVPTLIVVAGLFGISEWDSRQRADDIADVDAAVLADDMPISAYADRGFGVFLRNVSEGDRE